MVNDLPHGLTAPGILDLTTCDGNAGAIVGAVRKALRRAGNPSEAIVAAITDMYSGDYDHLLQVAMTVTEDDE